MPRTEATTIFGAPLPSKKFYVIGASHAGKIALHLEKYGKDFLENKKFKLISVTSPGKTFLQLVEQKLVSKELVSQMQPEDVVLVCAFGNGLFPRKNVKVKPSSLNVYPYSNKCFHLTKSETQIEKVKAEILLAKELFHECKAKVIFLDNLWRHILCCTVDPWKETLFYQKSVNELIRQELGTRFTVLTHRSLINEGQLSIEKPRHVKRYISYYFQLTRDRVHLTGPAYTNLTLNLIKWGISEGFW